MNTEHLQKVEKAIARLKSLADGDLGVVDVIACGREAIPALKSILFARERSGLYQTRCRAVAALSALGAADVLIEFLETERFLTDPVERVGEDAVINAAARVLPNVRDPYVFGMLMRLGHHSRLTGVIGALGASGRVEAIPVLLAALEDDASQPIAEAALRRLGRRTGGALLYAATTQLPTPERERPSSVRRRRSALGILAEIGVTRQAWPMLRRLIDDNDVKIAVLACEICLGCGSAVERFKATRCLIALLAHSDSILRDEIEQLLTRYFAVTSGPIEAYLRERLQIEEDAAAKEYTETVLHRIITRASSTE
jgi:hypothetical protein